MCLTRRRKIHSIVENLAPKITAEFAKLKMYACNFAVEMCAGEEFQRGKVTSRAKRITLHLASLTANINFRW